MNVRQTSLMLWGLAAVMAVVAATALVAGLLIPPAMSASGSAAAGSVLTRPARRAPTLSQLQQVASVDLRRPLFDLPPMIVPVQAPRPLAVRLTGTVLDPGGALAVVITPEGKTELKAVGETTGGAQVLDVGADEATFLFNGQKVTLKVEKRAGAIPGGQG